MQSGMVDHTHTYIRTYIHTYIHTYIRTYVRTCTCIQIITYTRKIQNTCTHTHTNAHSDSFCRKELKAAASPNSPLSKGVCE